MRRFARLVTTLVPTLLVAAGAVAQATETPAAAAPAGDAAPASKFTEEKLEQIAAPVALYPDALLMQVFMASTYPLEVVEADRWMKKEKLSGDALETALKDQTWDPSVKSLCTLPDVLSRMSENLDWTRDMGDAFLEQQTQLMDSVQHLRDKAYQTGNLETTEQQTVTVQPDKIIVIEQTDPQIIYVPTYSPTVVYGTWPYPTTYYAPLYAPPPPGYGALAFTTGVLVGAAIWGNCNWGWGHSSVNINVNHYNNFNRNTNNNFNRVTSNNWNHDASHRKGVNYRDPQTAQRYGGSGEGNRVSRNEARGFDKSRAGTANRAGTMDRAGAGAGNRAGTMDRSGAANRAGTTNRAGSGSRASAGTNRASGASGGAYSGARTPSRDMAGSSRGASSRATSGASRGGGSRSGGSRGGGSRGGGRRR